MMGNAEIAIWQIAQRDCHKCFTVDEYGATLVISECSRGSQCHVGLLNPACHVPSSGTPRPPCHYGGENILPSSKLVHDLLE